MANIKIAQLANKTTLADTDIIIVESAAATEKMTVAKLKELLGISNGGIVDTGSNANGSYVKYADGTMICQHRLIYNGVSIAANGITPGVQWTKPATFVNKGTSKYSEVASFSGLSQYGAPLPMISTKGGWIGGEFTHRGVNYSSEPITDYYIDLFAIGRWK